MDVAMTADPAASPSPPICLYGLDEAGRPHASRFAGVDIERATRAAELMGLHVLALASPDCGDLAGRLPPGRLFEKSGRAFVPYVARPLYERLAALGGIPVLPPAPKPGKTAKPVAAPQTAAKAATGDKDPKAGTKTAKLAASRLAPSADVEPSGVPTDWPLIRDGSLVLATTGGPAEGWFESVVVEAKEDGLLVLRWRDFADAIFLRRREQLALLPAGTPLAAKS